MTRHAVALDHLSHVDPVMRRLIREVGPCTLLPRVDRTPFESLARAIAYQQLHDKAAESILSRFVTLFPERRFPTPEAVLAMEEASLRSAGFSWSKIKSLRDLAAKTLDGIVPTGRTIQSLEDGAIIERLTEVHGIGRWKCC